MNGDGPLEILDVGMTNTGDEELIFVQFQE